MENLKKEKIDINRVNPTQGGLHRFSHKCCKKHFTWSMGLLKIDLLLEKAAFIAALRRSRKVYFERDGGGCEMSRHELKTIKFLHTNLVIYRVKDG